MATIQKRVTPSGEVRWRAIVRRGAGGKSHYESKTFRTRREAAAWAAEREAELGRAGLPADALEMPLRELWRQYLARKVPSHRGSRSDEARLLRWIESHPLRDRPLQELRPADFARWRDERLAAAAAPETVIRELGLLSAVCNWARREVAGLEMWANPVSLVERPKRPVGRNRRVAWHEMLALGRACRDKRRFSLPHQRLPWLWPLIKLAWATAMRRGEILSLRWDDIDFHRRVAHLRETKNGQPRTVPLSRHALRALAELRELFPDDERVLPVSANAVNLAWQRIRRRAGVPDIRFHDLRHEATSRLAEAGWSDLEISAVTGHRDPRMLRRYAHLRPQDIAARLDEVHKQRTRAKRTRGGGL